jgi:hypothetical protein
MPATDADDGGRDGIRRAHVKALLIRVELVTGNNNHARFRTPGWKQKRKRK